ncbi:uncharacterized protein LOC135335132 isoform X2 [Halichondria panicea]
MPTCKPNETFLVRPKGNVDDRVLNHALIVTHTIDIVDGGRFKRIPVYRDPAGGYGFASLFFDLLSLVLYYATNTMEKHNPELETMLRYSAFHVDRGR